MAFKIVVVSTILAFVCFGTILAQEGQNEEVLKGIQDAIKNNDHNKTLEQAYSMLKEKCKKNAQGDWESAFNTIKKAEEELKSCASRNVNMAEIQQKINESIPLGKLDEVFKEYCQRKGILQKCFETYTATLHPCLSDVEVKNLKIVHNITAQLADFVCFKDGDRIALFIAEKGPECFTNNTEAIQRCKDKISKNNLTLPNLQDPASAAGIEELALFNLDFNRETCLETDKVEKCVVEVLKNCSEPTPSNIAESLFKFIRKATPCVSFRATTDARKSANAAPGLMSGISLIAVSIVSLFLI